MTTSQSTYRAVAAKRFLACAIACVYALLATGCEQSMVTRSNEAAAVLRDFSLSDQRIPESAFTGAQAIAVLHETEAGVVVNAGGGKGVMVQRTPKGWSAPIALDSSTGSFGAQIGGKSRDIVMVFRSADEVRKIIQSGGYSLADASATAGPMSEAAREDDNPVATYARVAGLFAGARIGGVKFDVNTKVNHETYSMRYTTEEILQGQVERPLGTSELYKYLPAPK
ncbi:MAG: lipid-binding SYLF domain-containing protein [Phycisphaerae bacterium]|nr:lipid-binding SYLF domain-containing protein [Phycisphaerae bacterium]